MKIVVLGAMGQLGRDLVPLLSGEVIPVTRAEVDLSAPGAITAYIERAKPDIVINCAAYNLVDKAESDPTAAFAVNAWAVRELAEACRNTYLVHVSTDYVYGLDATRHTPYREDDAPGPVSIYGLSKLNGEYLVRAIAPKHLVVRTCGLYGVWGTGGKGGNFVETMLRVASQGKPMRVVDDQRCTPTSTRDLTTMITGLIEHNATGLYHAVNAGDCSWFEFATEIFRLANLPVDLTPIPSSGYPTPAKRPPYSVLNTDKLLALGLPTPRHWKDALANYLHERQQRNA